MKKKIESQNSVKCFKVECLYNNTNNTNNDNSSNNFGVANDQNNKENELGQCLKMLKENKTSASGKKNENLLSQDKKKLILDLGKIF